MADQSGSGADRRVELRASSLLCPSCGSRMAGCAMEGLAVEQCLACGTLWLDPGELSAYATASRWRAAGVLPVVEASDRDGAPTDLRCPLHGESRLVTLRVLGEALASCPRCRGILVDRRARRALASAHRASDDLAAVLHEERAPRPDEGDLRENLRAVSALLRALRHL